MRSDGDGDPVSVGGAGKARAGAPCLPRPRILPDARCSAAAHSPRAFWHRWP